MRIRWSPEARRDAARLTTFLRKQSPDVAHRLMLRIVNATDSLADAPSLGRSVGDDLRQLIVPFGSSGYVIYYRVLDQDVFIARLWHGREERRSCTSPGSRRTRDSMCLARAF